MSFLVDGNNVMGQSPGFHRDRPGARRRLLAELADYVAATRARITVVFDGAPDPDVPDGILFRGVRVHYPARGRDADSLIEQILARSRDRRGIQVVTSDRQLAAECRSVGAKVVRSGDFRRLLNDAAARRSVPVDPGEEEQPGSESIEDWLRYFGADEAG